MIIIMRAAASGKPVGINTDQVRFIRANSDDVTTIVFGKASDEHTVLVKGSVLRVAEELNAWHLRQAEPERRVAHDR